MSGYRWVYHVRLRCNTHNACKIREKKKKKREKDLQACAPHDRSEETCGAQPFQPDCVLVSRLIVYLYVACANISIHQVQVFSLLAISPSITTFFLLVLLCFVFNSDLKIEYTAATKPKPNGEYKYKNRNEFYWTWKMHWILSSGQRRNFTFCRAN